MDEDGITYQVRVDATVIGDLVTGPRQPGESDANYSDRIMDSVDFTRIEEFVADTYGATTLPHPDSSDIYIEFFVPYGEPGASRSSLEAMGHKAAHTTQLEIAYGDAHTRNGERMQARLAKQLRVPTT